MTKEININGKLYRLVEEKPMKRIIMLTETTKAYPKNTYYKCEIGGMLNDTLNKNEAFVFEHIEWAEMVRDFIEETYDYKATLIEYKE